jgi:hypothetical protein
LRFLRIFIRTQQTIYVITQAMVDSVFLAGSSHELIWHEVIIQVITSPTVHAAVKGSVQEADNENKLEKWAMEAFAPVTESAIYLPERAEAE